MPASSNASRTSPWRANPTPDRRSGSSPRFATHVLGWEPADLVGTSEGGPLPDSLEVTLTEYNETLRPTYAVREFSNDAGRPRRSGSC